MLISGINKFSLIDYPGKISCIIFTAGCNFRCGFCHNSEFVLPEKLKDMSNDFIHQEAIFNFLKKRKGFLNGVSICGGEPTIHKDLPKFCKKIKDMGFFVKLDTNGQNPIMIKYLLDNKLIDYIAMDIKHQIGSFNLLAGVKLNEEDYLKSIKLILNSNIDYEFRTTVIKGIHNKKIIDNIAKYISGAKNYYLQNYRGGNTLDPKFIGESFTEEELKEIAKTGKKYIKNIQIRF